MRRGGGKAVGLPLALAAAITACSFVGCERARRTPPSILVFVLDTTRFDAISANGHEAGTTPTVDALAAEGLRYTRAYAQASWTLPSHASLFTGLLPSRHGVTWRRTHAPDALVMLAERLRDAGYETVGVAENPWLGDAFNMTQGFDRFTPVPRYPPRQVGPPDPDLRVGIDLWLRGRHDRRPFFLFVNVLDAHAPFKLRKKNPFLPPGVGVLQAASVAATKQESYFCQESSPDAMAIRRGLYLGGVSAADAKLRDVLARLAEAGLRDDLVTFVISDHGEHLGEHRLVDHLFSVREELVHVPLIVHGLDVPPATIDTPVRLVDVLPTILRLAGLDVPEGLAGGPLPTAPDPGARPDVAIAEIYEVPAQGPANEPMVAAYARRFGRRLRSACGPTDRVFGDMRAIVRYPWKLIRYERYPPQLYDLRADPDEANDLATAEPSVVETMSAELTRRVGTGAVAGDPTPGAAPSREILEQLRALGYLSDEQ